MLVMVLLNSAVVGVAHTHARGLAGPIYGHVHQTPAFAWCPACVLASNASASVTPVEHPVSLTARLTIPESTVSAVSVTLTQPHTRGPPPPR